MEIIGKVLLGTVNGNGLAIIKHNEHGKLGTQD